MILTQFKGKKKKSTHKQSAQRPSSQAPSLCHCVCLAEFDIKKGATLSHKYPHDVAIADSDEQSSPDSKRIALEGRSLPDLCIPDGAHVFLNDTSFLFLTQKHEGKTMYCVVHFMTKKDTSVKRNATQKSLLLFSYWPLLELYDHLCKIALQKIMQDEMPVSDVLEALHHSLDEEKVTKVDLTVNLWQHRIPVKMPAVKEDRFGALPRLSKLCELFGKDTMYLWYAMLQGDKRLMLVGTPSKQVGVLVMSLPLLVAPLKGFTSRMSPYISLMDISTPLMQQNSFFVGSTNHLMEVKEDWWDLLGSCAEGKVKFSGKNSIKLTATDKNHIENVLGGIQDGKSEEWVCEQFRLYTMAQLEKLRDGKKLRNKNLSSVKQSENYQRWEKEFEEQKNVSSPAVSTLDMYKELKVNVDSLPLLDRVKKTFQLSRQLNGLAQIDELCDQGAVHLFASWLDDSNSQIRKYSVQLLSQLVLSKKGQQALIHDEEGIDAVVKLLDDQMPNVRLASYYCMMKLSSSIEGRRKILSHDPQFIEKLLNDVEEKMNDVKIDIVIILRHMFAELLMENENPLKLPDIGSDVKNRFVDLFKNSADKILRDNILLLLDEWHVELDGIVPIQAQHKKLFDSFLSAETDSEKLEATRALSAQITAESNQVASTMVLEMAECKGMMDRLLENEQYKNDLELRTISSFIMLKSTFSHHATKRLALALAKRENVRQWVNFVIKRIQSHTLHTQHMLQILHRVFLHKQGVESVKAFCDVKGIHSLCTLIERFSKSRDNGMTFLCVIASHIIKSVVDRMTGDDEQEIMATIKEPIMTLSESYSISEEEASDSSLLKDIRDQLSSVYKSFGQP